jgi:hypothetical protein
MGVGAEQIQQIQITPYKSTPCIGSRIQKTNILLNQGIIAILRLCTEQIFACFRIITAQ